MKGFCQWSHWEQVRQTGNKSTATVIQEFHLKMSSVKWRPFRLGLNVLNIKKKTWKLTARSCFGRCTVQQASWNKKYKNKYMDCGMLDCLLRNHLYIFVCWPNDWFISWFLYRSITWLMTDQLIGIFMWMTVTIMRKYWWENIQSQNGYICYQYIATRYR